MPRRWSGIGSRKLQILIPWKRRSRSIFTRRTDTDRYYIFVGSFYAMGSFPQLDRRTTMRMDPNNPRQPRPDETGPMKRKEGERNRPGSNPEREDEGGYVEEER